MTGPGIPPPRRIMVSNLQLHSASSHNSKSEPAVEVRVDTLGSEEMFGGTLRRAPVATHASIPTNNDGSGASLDPVPGAGIVLPNGANLYYLDFAPGCVTPMHRTTSTDYVIVIKGTLTVITPSKAFDIIDGKGTYTSTETEETVAQQGDVIVQRGIMHALINRTDEWVRAMGIVLDAKPAVVRVGDAGETKALGEVWLQ